MNPGTLEHTGADLSEPKLSPHQLAALHGLVRVGGRPRLGQYLVDTWQRRTFAWQLAKSRYHSDHARTRLGRGWNILNPLFEVLIYGVIYYYLMGSGTRPGNYTAFVTIGAVVFQFMSRVLTNGARSIEANSGLIRSIRFPRALLPLAVVLQNLLELIPTICLILPISFLTGEPVRAKWLLIIPALTLAALFSLGLAYFSAWLTSHFKDTLQLLPHATRALFHLSGIFFSIYEFGSSSWIRDLMAVNPFGWYLTLTRSALMSENDITQHATSQLWCLSAGVAVLAFTVGYLLFWVGEGRYGRE